MIDTLTRASLVAIAALVILALAFICWAARLTIWQSFKAQRARRRAMIAAGFCPECEIETLDEGAVICTECWLDQQI